MTRNEMTELLGEILPSESASLDAPSATDWEILRKKFGCEFGESFIYFIDAMTCFCFPGDILNVSRGRTNGNDSIISVYDSEMKNDTWDGNMIPFYGIGNGDYFCLNRAECPNSPVYYRDHNVHSFERYCASFEEWVRALPEFLAV